MFTLNFYPRGMKSISLRISSMMITLESSFCESSKMLTIYAMICPSPMPTRLSQVICLTNSELFARAHSTARAVLPDP